MADSSVDVTPGSGASVDTRTEGTNGNHRQVMVIGDPATNAGVAPVDGTAGLKVDLGADNDVTVTGSVTANAGTNLNTSALALESGGNLAAVATSVQLIDDAIVADDAAFTPATTKVMMAGFEFDDTTPDSVNEGDAGAARMSANRNIYVTLRDAAGNERGLNVSAAGTVGVTVASGGVASGAVASGAVASGAFASGSIASGAMVDLGAIADAAVSAGATGSISAKLRSISRDLVANIVLAAGTNAIGKLAANSGVDIGDVDVTSAVITGGATAHDAADSGNPIKVGGRARSSEITAVANDDRTDFVTDLAGKQIVLPYANPENFVSGAITSAMTGTTSTSLVAAPGSGLRNYITTIIVSNAHATVGTDINIQDGSGGTTLLVIPAAAVYGGAVITLPTPLRQPTTNTALYCANVTTGASTKVSAVGYKGA